MQTNTNGHSPKTAVQILDMALPHSQEAETAVIGSLLINSDAYYEVSDKLQSGHFHNHFYGEVFRAIGNLLAENMPADAVTISELLSARNIRPVTGSVEDMLIAAMTEVPTAINAAHYARIVVSLAIRRQLIQAGAKVQSLAHDENMPLDDLIAQAETAVLGVSDAAIGDTIIPIADNMTGLFDTINGRRLAGGEFVGIPTGINQLDIILRGVKRQRLYIIAAASGMGKSTLANQIALNMATRAKRRGAIFNLEMSAEEIGIRMIANIARIDTRKVEEGRMSDAEFATFGRATGQLAQAQLFIDDSPALTPGQLRAKCRRIQAEHGLDFVIVDYLQLMTGDNGKYGNRELEVSHISHQLKSIAKQLDVPVIALSQLSRATDARADKRPQLSDLRESGAIGNNADCVMFLYRDEYYTDATERPNQAEIIVAKQRNGKTGTALTYFNGEYAQVSNLQLSPL